MRIAGSRVSKATVYNTLGLFAERQQALGQRWRGELGLRYNRVSMDADEVDGTPAQMMPPAAALRAHGRAHSARQRGRPGCGC